MKTAQIKKEFPRIEGKSRSVLIETIVPDDPDSNRTQFRLRPTPSSPEKMEAGGILLDVSEDGCTVTIGVEDYGSMSTVNLGTYHLC